MPLLSLLSVLLLPAPGLFFPATPPVCRGQLKTKMDTCLIKYEQQRIVYDMEKSNRLLPEFCLAYSQTLQCLFFLFQECNPEPEHLTMLESRIGQYRTFMDDACYVPPEAMTPKQMRKLTATTVDMRKSTKPTPTTTTTVGPSTVLTTLSTTSTSSTTTSKTTPTSTTVQTKSTNVASNISTSLLRTTQRNSIGIQISIGEHKRLFHINVNSADENNVIKINANSNCLPGSQSGPCALSLHSAAQRQYSLSSHLCLMAALVILTLHTHIISLC